uniref:Uncharacterized protein n=1 Tax=Eutreptiella gymnastica TaxID=73025 RepID=A0A7S4CWM6_9EUGL
MTFGAKDLLRLKAMKAIYRLAWSSWKAHPAFTANLLGFRLELETCRTTHLILASHPLSNHGLVEKQAVCNRRCFDSGVAVIQGWLCASAVHRSPLCFLTQ